MTDKTDKKERSFSAVLHEHRYWILAAILVLAAMVMYRKQAARSARRRFIYNQSFR